MGWGVGIPGGHEKPGSHFNPAEALGQEDCEKEPQKLIGPLSGLTLNSF